MDGKSIRSNWKRSPKIHYFPILSDRIDFMNKWKTSAVITTDWMVETQVCCLGTIDDRIRGDTSWTSIGRWRPEQQSRPRVQTIAQRTPAVAPPNIMAVASTFCPPARPDKRDENQAIDPKHRVKAHDSDSCIAVAVPCMAVKGFLRPPKGRWKW